MKKIFICFLLLISAGFIFPHKLLSFAKEGSLPSVTIINPLRGEGLGHENDNLFESLKDQWSVTKEVGVNATWLWQYGALEDKEMTDFAKNSMKNQEHGLLFEIDRNFAEKSGVSYRGQGPSYFSDGLLLVSYDKEERIKLIDSAFLKFKSVFGYYPKTVGVWWIGGDSIFYMQQKYKITAVLRASDQFELDVYTIWGTPWSIPYIPAKENEGIPANSWEESSRVVILQWAVRDPVKGYYDSTYSLQDYSLKGYDLSYVDYLYDNYLKNSSDNVVIGLENGGNLELFNGFYKNMISHARERELEGKIKTLLAKDYAEKFLSRKQIFAESSFNLFDDYDGNTQSLWINSKNYRAFIEKIDDNIFLSDLRDYSKKQNEEFYFLPNSQGKLWVGEKYIIDSKLFPESKKLIAKSPDKIKLIKNTDNTLVYAGNKKLALASFDNLDIYSDDKTISYSFLDSKSGLNPQVLIFLFYSIYMLLFYILTKDKRKVAIDGLIFFIILFLAYPFITQSITDNTDLLFDRKEQLLFYLLPFGLFPNIKTSLILLQILPLLAFPILHGILRLRKNTPKYLYFLIVLVYVFIYSHVSYFPLNKTNAIIILSILFSILVFVVLLACILYLKTKSKNLLKKASFIIALILILGFAVLYSRAKEVITPFEIEALQVVKNQNKNVIYVSQQDYSIRPIYKAVRPLLFDNFKLSENLTGVNWDNVLRPQSHILKINDYKNKLIYIPRYLGSDISEYEIKKLGLKKIFDNLQIAIYYSE